MTIRRPVYSEDLFQIKAVSDPQVSPDGSRVAYVQTLMVRETNKYSSRIWTVSTSGKGQPEAFTSGPGLDFAPRWSPDGRFLAYISTRSGSRQIWIMPSVGGEAKLLSRIRNVASAPVWSPDSRTIACIIRLGLQKDEDGEEQQPKERYLKDVLVIDQIRYKLDTAGFLINKVWHLFTIKVSDPEPGQFQQLTFGNYRFSSPAWSPDGRFIAVSGYPLPESIKLVLVNDIWVVTSTGGKPKRLTQSRGPANYPSWSPDGHAIAYIGHDRRRGNYTNQGIWTVTFDRGETKELTAGFKYPVGDYSLKDVIGYAQPGVTPCWSPDGQAIYMIVSSHGAVHLWQFSTIDKRALQLTYGHLVIYNLSFSQDTSRLALAVTAPHLPNDIWAGEIIGDSVRERRLTRVNQDWLNRVTVIKPHRFTFRSPDGPEAEGWMLYPTRNTGAEKFPAILQIHGGPTLMYGYVFFLEFQLLAANGFAVIYTNPRGSMGYGQEFADVIRGDWGNRDYADLLSAVDTALLQGKLDPESLGVAGGSYGGYMTNWIVTQNNRFKAAVSMRGISNLYSYFGTSDGGFLHADDYGGPPWELPEKYLKQSPITYVSHVRTPILLIHSDLDFRVPIEQGEQFFTALKFLQRKVRMIRFLTETHELSRRGEPWHRVIRLDHIIHWFQEHLKKPSYD